MLGGAATAAWLYAMCTLCAANSPALSLVGSSASIRVTGTSTLHDWEIHAETVYGSLHLSGQSPEGTSAMELLDLAQPQHHPALDIRVPVRSLKSGKNAMDKITWKTLQSAQHPEIRFTLLDLQPAANSGQEPTEVLPVLYRGDLFAAGITRTIEITGTAEKTETGHLKFTGSGSLNMTDFNIQPPAVMLGLIKAGDEVWVDFSFLFEMQP